MKIDEILKSINVNPKISFFQNYIFIYFSISTKLELQFEETKIIYFQLEHQIDYYWKSDRPDIIQSQYV